ncbi:hypothetical protein NMY22_g13981 [Coprinellus aureogranulatus]|nr:hypothetical protein NMY22_g13981 [Coprinellus aureogranulatus]
MMGKFARYLPDMDFPINAKAEGRVLIPWEHQQYPNLTRRDSSGGVEDMLGGPFNPDWGTDGNSWEAWRRTCHPNSTSRRLYSSLRDPFVLRQKNYLRGSGSPSAGEDFEFAENTAADFDFCQHPHEHYNQGHFFTDWRSIPVLYPVFSPARAKGYMDVRIPSHYYYGSTKGYTYGWDFEKKVLTPVDKMEKPWDEKIDKIFWRGATTGGGSHPPGFSPQYHRHRFLRMASDRSNNTRVVTYNPPNATHWESIEMPISTLNDDIMDTAFVKVSGLYPGGLSALMEKHRFSEPVPLGKHWSYKYLVDLDGMSYSGRFMAFLASDSVPIKATVYSEFFSDWIEPWLHFIPLSPSYKEIYNLFTFFHGPTQGVWEAINSTLASLPPEERISPEDERLRKIAMAGKEWKKTIARTLDMEDICAFVPLRTHASVVVILLTLPQGWRPPRSSHSRFILRNGRVQVRTGYHPVLFEFRVVNDLPFCSSSSLPDVPPFPSAFLGLTCALMQVPFLVPSTTRLWYMSVPGYLPPLDALTSLKRDDAKMSGTQDLMRTLSARCAVIVFLITQLIGAQQSV